MTLLTKFGEKRICREHRIAFSARRCPKCEAFRRMVYEASIRALGRPEQYMSIRVPQQGNGSVPQQGNTAEPHARIPLSVWTDPKLHRADVHVYRVLAQAVWQGNVASIGMRRIAEESRMTLKNAHACIGRLVNGGHLQILAAERGRRAMYILTSNVFGQKQGKVDEVISAPSGKRLVSVRKTA